MKGPVDFVWVSGTLYYYEGGIVSVTRLQKKLLINLGLQGQKCVLNLIFLSDLWLKQRWECVKKTR